MSQRTLPEDIERLVARDLRDPHALLGAHPDDGGVVLRAFRPDAERVTAHVLDPTDGAGTEPVELERVHTAGLFEGRVPGARLPLRYELEVAYPDGLVVRGRDAVRLPADDRRGRPAPRRRGPPRGALREARRARARGRRRRGRRLRRLGAVRPVGERRGRLQLLGRPAAPDALARPDRDLGGLPPRRRGGLALQVRDPDAVRRAGPEGRPVRLRGRGPAADRLGRRRARGTSGTTRPGWRVARSATRRPAR